MRGSYRFKKCLVLATVAVLAIVVSVLIAVPYINGPSVSIQGDSVHVEATVTSNSVTINECYLRKTNTSNIDTTSNVSPGPNTVTVMIYDCWGESNGRHYDLFSIAKNNAGAGSYIFDSPILPRLQNNNPLLVHISVYKADGSVLVQNETTILYK
jgi:hypothetical protein